MAEVVDAYFETGASEVRDGEWVVPTRWYTDHGDPPPGDLDGERDLRGEIRAAVESLPAEALEEVADAVESGEAQGTFLDRLALYLRQAEGRRGTERAPR